MKPIEIFLSKLTHIGFYVLMIGMPLLGWAMISASTLPIENELFYLIQLPDLPGVTESKTLEMTFKQFHEIGAKLIILLFLLHMAGAIKHQFLAKDNLMARMIPALRKKR